MPDDSKCSGCCVCQDCQCVDRDSLCEDCLDCENCECKNNNTCQLVLDYYVDETWCLCQNIPPPEYPTCHGGGRVEYHYNCTGSCPNECCDCVRSGLCGSVRVLKYKYPNPCEDTGLWPLGNECNEDADCEITGWEEEWGYVEDCCCHYECV